MTKKQLRLIRNQPEAQIINEINDSAAILDEPVYLAGDFLRQFSSTISAKHCHHGCTLGGKSATRTNSASNGGDGYSVRFSRQLKQTAGKISDCDATENRSCKRYSRGACQLSAPRSAQLQIFQKPRIGLRRTRDNEVQSYRAGEFFFRHDRIEGAPAIPELQR